MAVLAVQVLSILHDDAAAPPLQQPSRSHRRRPAQGVVAPTSRTQGDAVSQRAARPLLERRLVITITLGRAHHAAPPAMRRHGRLPRRLPGL